MAELNLQGFPEDSFLSSIHNVIKHFCYKHKNGENFSRQKVLMLASGVTVKESLAFISQSKRRKQRTKPCGLASKGAGTELT